jgi:hypothetical protein
MLERPKIADAGISAPQKLAISPHILRLSDRSTELTETITAELMPIDAERAEGVRAKLANERLPMKSTSIPTDEGLPTGRARNKKRSGRVASTVTKGKVSATVQVKPKRTEPRDPCAINIEAHHLCE